MNDKLRRKTGIALLSLSLFMFSPIAMHLAGFRVPMLLNLGLTVGAFAPWPAWLLALVVTVAYLVYTFKTIPLVLRMQREFSPFKLVGLFAGLTAGIVEEVFFRRWLMDLLMTAGLGVLAQVAISALAFGLAHGMWSLFNRDLRFIRGAVLSTTALGMALAVVYVVGGRNLGPCIVAHSLISMTIEPWLLLAAMAGPMGYAGSVRRQA
jgi:hypothetical protein